MSIDHSQQTRFPLLWLGLIKPSHRTSPEQLVGFGIFLLISLGVEFINGKLIQSAIHSSWYNGLNQAPWALPEPLYAPLWTGYFFFLALSVWTLWRRISLRSAKLEISVFFAQYVFQAVWSISFFCFHETLLGLVALLLLLSNNVLSALLFWKKERLAGQFLVLPFVWIFYVIGLNMVIRILNP